MLQVPEEVVEEVMVALMRLGLGDAVDGVALAAVHLMSERRRAREQEARAQLEDQAAIEEIDDEGEGEACALPCLPPPAPQPEPIPVLRQPIPLGAAPGEAAPEEPRRVRDASSQTGLSDLPARPTWPEVEALLQQAKDLDTLSLAVQAEGFAAFDDYLARHPDPNPILDSWRSRVAMKRELDAHVEEWVVERRRRLQREREERNRRERARIEEEYAEARRRRLEEEEAITSARNRWEEARRAEERAAIGLGIAQPRGTVPNPPGTGKLRRCPVCAWPGVREARRCPRVATHPQRPEGPPSA